MLFIQSDLQCIQAIHFFFLISMCVPWELNPQPFALLTQCSTTEPQECFLLSLDLVFGVYKNKVFMLDCSQNPLFPVCLRWPVSSCFNKAPPSKYEIYSDWLAGPVCCDWWTASLICSALNIINGVNLVICCSSWSVFLLKRNISLWSGLWAL